MRKVKYPWGVCYNGVMDTSNDHGYNANKEQLLKRLRRAEGQVRGVAKMVEDDRYCIDILTQIAALQAALDKVALGLMDDHIQHCLVKGSSTERAERADELVATIGRLMR
jgi:CsoR family transcriptional regulator, copper-sensing transcriptional repressor